MNNLIQQYIEYGFPIIPLVPREKSPAARGWDKNRYPASAFHNRNVGIRAGEKVNINGKEGHLLIVDFDSPDLSILKQLCATVPLTRTTCIRTGGGHMGYHLFYLTKNETRKRGMLAYRDASIDLLGKGSFAVAPPSIVDQPYRYLVGLDEIAVLPCETYDALVAILQQWKQIKRYIKQVSNQKLSYTKALTRLTDQEASPEMIDYFQTATNQFAK